MKKETMVMFQGEIMARVITEIVGDTVTIHLPTMGSISTPWDEASPIKPASLPYYDKLVLPLKAFRE